MWLALSNETCGTYAQNLCGPNNVRAQLAGRRESTLSAVRSLQISTTNLSAQ